MTFEASTGLYNSDEYFYIKGDVTNTITVDTIDILSPMNSQLILDYLFYLFRFSGACKNIDFKKLTLKDHDRTAAMRVAQFEYGNYESISVTELTVSNVTFSSAEDDGYNL